MMKLPTIKLAVRTAAKNKDGDMPLVIQIVYNRKTYLKSVGVSVNQEVVGEKELKGNDKKTLLMNIELRQTISALESNFMKLHEKGMLNHEMIKNVVAGDKMEQFNITELYEKVKKIYTGVLTEKRLGKLEIFCNKFRAWNNIPITQITPATLVSYEGYLRKELKHRETTISSNMVGIKTIINKGLEHKLIKYNPFTGYKMPGYKNPKRNYLIESQVDTIEQYADDEANHVTVRKVAAWFVLGCYSGMRYGDLERFDEKRMVIGNRLYFSDQKEESPHFIPIYPKLRIAIERVRQYNRIPTNQECNRTLKVLGPVCGIPLALTMHLARHTFAVTYLTNKGSKDVLQRLMGHKKAETTAIYGQITDVRIEAEVSEIFKS